VEDTGLSSYPRQEIGFPTSPGIRVAIGDIDQAPLAGTWSLSYGGDLTTALAFNATPAVVQTALNLLASITAAGGVTVSKIGDNYNILFNSVGARTELTTDGSALIPLSAATIATLQAGSASKPAIFLCHLQRTVAGLATSFSPTANSQITTEALTAWDDTKATYRVSISPDPKGGSFSLSFDALVGTDVSTAAISVGASALDVQNALGFGALAEGKVSVTQVGAYAYDITVGVHPGTNGLTADDAGLLSFSGYKGELSLNTVEAVSIIDGADSVTTTLEVEITSDSKRLTVLQIPCTLKNAVIDEGALQPLVLDSYLSQTIADGRYFKLSQNLADGTAGNMRTNLGVYSTSQVDTALALKADDTDLLLKADLFEPVFSGKIQTPTIKNILNADLVIDSYNDTGAGTHYLHKFTPFDGKLVLATNGGGLTFPDGTTQSTAFTGVAATSWGTITGTISSQLDLASALAGKAATSHTHIIGDVTGLQTALDGKAATSHTQVISTVTGLQTALDVKANLSGATFTGKANFTTVSGVAGINIGVGGTNTASTTAGDLWITTGGTSLNFRDGNGTWRTVASTGSTNTFAAAQIIDTTASTPGLRITQKGTGSAFVVEDTANPDANALIVDANGNLGIGVSNNPGTIWAGSTYKMEVYGAMLVTGYVRCSYQLDVGTSGDLGMTVAGGIQFGDYTYNSSASMTLGGQRVESNPNTSGSFSSTDYPNEIVFKLDGSFYAVPCRVIT
jgi:hypothetical protein